jgi:hypothetical protein
MFQTPAGVGPGQQIIVVIVDSVGGTAQSTNISDYNAAITSAASGISYQGGSIGSWSIIGSTAATNAATALFASPLPVYDIVGHLLSSSGQTYLTGVTPSFTETGGQVIPNTNVWTGLGNNATTSPFALGAVQTQAVFGFTGVTVNTFGINAQIDAIADRKLYYGYATFTAPTVASVPAPGSITLAFVGLVVSLASRGARRRRLKSPATIEHA